MLVHAEKMSQAPIRMLRNMEARNVLKKNLHNVTAHERCREQLRLLVSACIASMRMAFVAVLRTSSHRPRSLNPSSQCKRRL